jgi:hypothetical protein
MARFYAAEDIDLTTSVSTLDRTLIDHTSGARAERAFCSATTPIFISLVTTDDLTSANAMPLDANEIFEIIGFDNLVQFRFNAQSGTGSLHVEYET